MEILSPRERAVMERLIKGYRNKEIALELQISPKTVSTFRERLMTKLEVRSVAELVRWADRQAA